MDKLTRKIIIAFIIYIIVLMLSVLCTGDASETVNSTTVTNLWPIVIYEESIIYCTHQIHHQIHWTSGWLTHSPASFPRTPRALSPHSSLCTQNTHSDYTVEITM